MSCPAARSSPVSFSEIVHNQIFVVSRQLSADRKRYLFKRKALMQQIEDRPPRCEERSSDASTKSEPWWKHYSLW
ncbi:MAG: hypothetical protein DMG54_36025 [Acidobacteria bacterium]|nr:MAG: hypothetical protein DMG54_36025 [Acidobacteriota bacterium]